MAPKKDPIAAFKMIIAKELSATILAAGRSSRLGRDKVLLELGGESIVGLIAQEVIKTGFAECIVVTNPKNHAVVEQITRGPSVKAICNDRYEDGMAGSVRIGVVATSPYSRAMVLLQGDQPLIESSMLSELMVRWEGTTLPYVASSYDELVTTPVLFSRELFPELETLQGDAGARRVLTKHRGATVQFPAWRGADVDTELDYTAIQKVWRELHPKSATSAANK